MKITVNSKFWYFDIQAICSINSGVSSINDKIIENIFNVFIYDEYCMNHLSFQLQLHFLKVK